jgi:Tfp pilus assembly protein PilN
VRPINLIPQEERRAGSGATARTGPLAYIVVGALAVLLIGVVMLVLTSNQISDRKAEVTTLEAQKVAASARADKLAPYTAFKQVTEQRTQTISSLADSRFDWPRVIRQMALIVPAHIYLAEVIGSAGGVAGEGGSSEVAGPSLTLEGCAPRQQTVAAFVASLKEIDGVTRVGLNESKLNTENSGGNSSGYCSLPGLFKFRLVVAFDLAPPSPDGESAISEATEEGESEGSEEGTEAEGSGETASSGTEAAG